MLVLAQELKPAIQRYATMDKKFPYKLEEDEWEALGVLAGHLKIFYDATLKLSGSKYPTLNLFFPEYCEVFLALKKMLVSPYPFVELMAKEMFVKWDNYWTSGNLLLAIACVLDPRSKFETVEYYIEKLYPNDVDRLVANIKSCMNSLFKEYLEEHSKSMQAQSGSSTSAQQGRKLSTSVVSDTRAGLKDRFLGKKGAEPVKSDLDRYLSDPLDESSIEDDFDILAWWKINAPKYPVLAKLARDVLAVPISTVASESAFSNCGRTLSPIRSCLHNETVEALICAQDWLRAAVIENGGEVSDSMWNFDEVAPDESVCN